MSGNKKTCSGSGSKNGLFVAPRYLNPRNRLNSTAISHGASCLAPATSSPNVAEVTFNAGDISAICTPDYEGSLMVASESSIKRPNPRIDRPKTTSDELKQEAQARKDAEDEQQALDEAYNMYLIAAALGKIVGQAKKRVTTEVDEQLSQLQKQLMEQKHSSDEMSQRAPCVELLGEETSLLTSLEKKTCILKAEDALVNVSKYDTLKNDLEMIRNQLPCKDFVVPQSKEDIETCKQVTLNVVKMVDNVLKTDCGFSAECNVSSALLKDAVKATSSLASHSQSLDQVVPMTDFMVMDEAASKIVWDSN